MTLLEDRFLFFLESKDELKILWINNRFYINNILEIFRSLIKIRGTDDESVLNNNN